MTAWFRHVAAAAQLEIQQVLTHPVEWLTASWRRSSGA